MRTQYTFSELLTQTNELDNQRVAWIDQIVHDYRALLTYNLESKCATVKITVQEPSDLYIHLHNAYRRGLISGYTAEAV